MLPNPLPKSSFTLDVGGVVGFFGGEEAVTAMKSIHLFAGRQWLGWYNTPGTYDLGRYFGQLPPSPLWKGLLSGPKSLPEPLFELEGKDGPGFISISSGTKLEHTGQFGHLLLNKCERVPVNVDVKGRPSTPMEVTIASVLLSGDLASSTFPAPVIKTPYVLAELIPIIGSWATSITCAVYGDWFIFVTIFLGIIAHGIAAAILGSGKLFVKHPVAAQGSPIGDGLLMRGKDIVIILGEENAVNTVTRGAFTLKYRSMPLFDDVGFSSLLLIIQFIAQILLVPQGTLFGQVMFLASLAVTWGFNSYISSQDLDDLQADMLFRDDGTRADASFTIASLTKLRLPTRTAVAAFVFYVLRSNKPDEISVDLLKHVVPNDTPVWREWRRRVAHERFDMDGIGEMSLEDQNLLKMLLGDAQQAKQTYDGHARKWTERAGDSKEESV